LWAGQKRRNNGDTMPQTEHEWITTTQALLRPHGPMEVFERDRELGILCVKCDELVWWNDIDRKRKPS